MRTDRDGEPSTITQINVNASAVVNQASGILMERHRTSINDAFRALCDAAEREGRDIEEEASAMVNSVDRILTHAPAPTMPSVALTPRELEMLRELPTLSSVEGIASAHFVTANTVKTHLRSVYQKLGVATRRDAVAEARRLGLI